MRASLQTDITLYDASYLALADSSSVRVYTADSVLLEATDGSAYSEGSYHIRDYESR